jgi:hypothetical protein
MIQKGDSFYCGPDKDIWVVENVHEGSIYFTNGNQWGSTWIVDETKMKEIGFKRLKPSPLANQCMGHTFNKYVGFTREYEYCIYCDSQLEDL